MRAPEDDHRGRCFIYFSVKRASFEPFPRAIRRIEVAVPIGWSFIRDNVSGVVLRNMYYESADAATVELWARQGRDGFEVIVEDGLHDFQRKQPFRYRKCINLSP